LTLSDSLGLNIFPCRPMQCNKNVRFGLAVFFALAVHVLFLSVNFHWQAVSLQLPRQQGQGVTVHLAFPVTTGEKTGKATDNSALPMPMQTEKPSPLKIEKNIAVPAVEPPVLGEQHLKKTIHPVPISEQVELEVQPEPESIETLTAVQPVPLDSKNNQAVKETAGSKWQEAGSAITADQAAEIAQEPGGMRDAVPLYKVNRPPEYPIAARKRGYQGIVLLEVFVRSDGKVDDVQVAESSGHLMLDSAAVKAVGDWLFSPGFQDGSPVDMWVRIPVRFELQ
jgi:protein TonB